MNPLRVLMAACWLLVGGYGLPVMAQGPATVIKGVNLIDGTGAGVRSGVNLVLQGDRITGITPATAPAPAGARVVDLSGKTVMPAMVNAHGHLGLIKGMKPGAENYTEANIIRQLKQYEKFGITHILCLGTDRELIFPLRKASREGKMDGATIYTAGYGITARNGMPPPSFSDKLLRPQTAAEAEKAVQQLAALKVDFIKMWVDDGGGTAQKMSPEVYEAVIREAHKHKLRVAAHVFYLEDARRLVAAGLDVIAHSIRDKEVDADLINAMKEKGVYYIPTLSLDEYNFVYAGQPDWINDPFFRASLEPGVWEMLTSDEFRDRQQKDTTRAKKMMAFHIASRNLHKLDSAGVKIAMGTDSGAQPIRAQGFSEHLELQLMTETGMDPLKAIACATRNGAALLGIGEQYGTLETGKKADFVVLDGNPEKDIRQTRTILSVWRNGKAALSWSQP